MTQYDVILHRNNLEHCCLWIALEDILRIDHLKALIIVNDLNANGHFTVISTHKEYAEFIALQFQRRGVDATFSESKKIPES